MSDAGLSLSFAALLFFVALLAALRGELAAVSTATGRALWSLSRHDERTDHVREGLAVHRAAIDSDRARLSSTQATIIRAKTTAQLLMKVLKLRRAILE
jgi:hypothetical protein